MRRRLTDLAEAITGAVRRRRGEESPLGRVAAVLMADYPAGAGDADDRPGERLDDRIGDLARSFDLTPLDQRLLTAAVAGELDPNFALAHGLLAGGAGAAWPTVAGALELAGAGTADLEARRRLHALSPLVHHGLVEVVGTGPTLLRSVTVPERVTSFVLGDDTPDPVLVRVLTEVWPLEGDVAAPLAHALGRGVRLTWVRGPLGTAGASLAVGAARATGYDPLVVDLERVPGDRVAEVVRAAVLEAGMYGQALVVLGASTLVPHEGPSLLGLLDACPAPVVGVSDRTWDATWSARIPYLVDAPRIPPEERPGVWRASLEAAATDAGVTLALGADDPGWSDLLAMRLTPEEIGRTTRDAALAAAVSGRPVDATTLRGAVRHLTARGDQGSAHDRTSASFDDIVLPDPAMRDLERLVSWARHRDEVLAQGPLQGAGGKASGIAALFAGSPGTGKTLAAHVVSDALALDLFQVDLSSVVDKYVGETEKNLERIFREAESMNVVLFFDEADSLFGTRSAVSDARDRYANLEVSYLLQRMERFDGITILATNLRGNLDAAFLRRLQFLITFPDPDAATRRRIWERHLSHVARLDGDDAPDVALLADHLELAGGDIRNVVLAAAYDAAEDADGVLGMRHLAAAAAREFGKLRKRPPAPLLDLLGIVPTGGSGPA